MVAQDAARHGAGQVEIAWAVKLEVDETYVGGEEAGVHGRETGNKAIGAVAVESQEPDRFGRVRLCRVPDVSGASLVPFVREMVEAGSEVLIDGWSGYNTLPEPNYIHSKPILSSSGDPAHVLMPGVHRIAALLQRWLLDTHQGAVSNKYLDHYLDEYTFRFNRRSARARGLLFYRLVEQAVQVEHISRTQTIHGCAMINHNIEWLRERSGCPHVQIRKAAVASLVFGVLFRIPLSLPLRLAREQQSKRGAAN